MPILNSVVTVAFEDDFCTGGCDGTATAAAAPNKFFGGDGGS